jgi:adenosylhomocysteine nucleosidase
LILYAFAEEGRMLAGRMAVSDSSKILGRRVLEGRLSGKEIVLAESGVGMTNAAMTTQRLIDRFDPRRVIFTGIAGAIDSAVKIGDIVICDKWITHDYVYHGAEGPEPRAIGVHSPDADSVLRIPSFDVDSLMLASTEGLMRVSESLMRIGDRIPSIWTGGVGVSGNSFIDNVEKRVWLQREFGALITDMETAAVAQVCYVNHIPFIAFRSASDLAGGSGSSTARAQLDQFFEVAAENSSRLVMEFLNALK